MGLAKGQDWRASNKRTNARARILDNKFKGEMALRESGLLYSIVRTGVMMGGHKAPPTDRWPGREHLVFVPPKASLGTAYSIHRTDVAAVLCKALTDPHAQKVTIEIAARAP